MRSSFGFPGNAKENRKKYLISISQVSSRCNCEQYFQLVSNTYYICIYSMYISIYDISIRKCILICNFYLVSIFFLQNPAGTNEIYFYKDVFERMRRDIWKFFHNQASTNLIFIFTVSKIIVLENS